MIATFSSVQVSRQPCVSVCLHHHRVQRLPRQLAPQLPLLIPLLHKDTDLHRLSARVDHSAGRLAILKQHLQVHAVPCV